MEGLLSLGIGEVVEGLVALAVVERGFAGIGISFGFAVQVLQERLHDTTPCVKPARSFGAWTRDVGQGGTNLGQRGTNLGLWMGNVGQRGMNLGF